MPAKKFRVYQEDRCSDEFRLAFIGSGSNSVECTACGRIHFTHHESEWDDRKEYKRLMKLSEKNPRKYFPSDETTVSWTTINNFQIIFDCPCNYAGVYESSISRHSDSILDYLEKMFEEEQKDADKNTEKIKRVRATKK